MTKTDQFEVNFFKPKSDHAKANTKLIITLALIWAIAVFGFQFLLIVLNKPTPEKSFKAYESVWPQVVEDAEVAPEAKQTFAKSVLFVLGKNIAVKDDHKAALKEALSWTVYSMQDEEGKAAFKDTPAVETAVSSIGLSSDGFDRIMIDLLPSSLVKVESDMLSEETIQAIPKIMELYLVHNRNAFTNFKFIGFPFHYWYTAQFLLIMFVILCLIYAVLIDRMNHKFNFVEED